MNLLSKKWIDPQVKSQLFLVFLIAFPYKVLKNFFFMLRWNHRQRIKKILLPFRWCNKKHLRQRILWESCLARDGWGEWDEGIKRFLPSSNTSLLPFSSRYIYFFRRDCLVEFKRVLFCEIAIKISLGFFLLVNFFDDGIFR